MLKAIWPSLAKVPNQLATGANITSSGMLCYVIFWCLQFPFMLVSPQKVRWLFVVKSILVPIAWLSMLIWAFVKVPVSEGLFVQSANISGRALVWAWLRAMNTSTGINSTLAVNIMDFTVSKHHLVWSLGFSEICVEICKEWKRVRQTKSLDCSRTWQF